jgi:hypothetical protein
MAEDYKAMPLFFSSKENRLLNDFFTGKYVLEDIHTSQGPARPKDTSDSGANRRAEASVVLGDEEGADLISPASQISPTLELEILGGSRNGAA